MNVSKSPPNISVVLHDEPLKPLRLFLGLTGTVFNMAAFILLLMSKRIRPTLKTALLGLTLNDMLLMATVVFWGTPLSYDCLAVLFTVASSLGVSNLVTVVLALHSYLAVFYPLRCHQMLSFKRNLATVVGCWALGWLIALVCVGVTYHPDYPCLLLVVMPRVGIMAESIICFLCTCLVMFMNIRVMTHLKRRAKIGCVSIEERVNRLPSISTNIAQCSKNTVLSFSDNGIRVPSASLQRDIIGSIEGLRPQLSPKPIDDHKDDFAAAETHCVEIHSQIKESINLSRSQVEAEEPKLCLQVPFSFAHPGPRNYEQTCPGESVHNENVPESPMKTPMDNPITSINFNSKKTGHLHRNLRSKAKKSATTNPKDCQSISNKVQGLSDIQNRRTFRNKMIRQNQFAATDSNCTASNITKKLDTNTIPLDVIVLDDTILNYDVGPSHIQEDDKKTFYKPKLRKVRNTKRPLKKNSLENTTFVFPSTSSSHCNEETTTPTCTSPVFYNSCSISCSSSTSLDNLVYDGNMCCLSDCPSGVRRQQQQGVVQGDCNEFSKISDLEKDKDNDISEANSTMPFSSRTYVDTRNLNWRPSNKGLPTSTKWGSLERCLSAPNLKSYSFPTINAHTATVSPFKSAQLKGSLSRVTTLPSIIRCKSLTAIATMATTVHFHVGGERFQKHTRQSQPAKDEDTCHDTRFCPSVKTQSSSRTEDKQQQLSIKVAKRISGNRNSLAPWPTFDLSEKCPDRDNTTHNASCEDKPFTYSATSSSALKSEMTLRRHRNHQSSTTRTSWKRRTQYTLILLSTWCCVLTVPYIVYGSYLAICVTNRGVFARSSVGVLLNSCLALNAITNPILYAWRFIEWRNIWHKVYRR